jgi:hypothetical protein
LNHVIGLVRFGVVAATLSLLIQGCALRQDPPVECQEMAPADCQRAADISRSIAPDYWWAADSVLIHFGYCTRYMRCPPSAWTTKNSITVELITRDPDQAFVRIDLRANWDAQCIVLVHDPNGAHTVPCTPG